MSKAIANTVDRALDSGIESGRKAVKRGPIATADDRDTQASVRRHGDGPMLCNTLQQVPAIPGESDYMVGLGASQRRCFSVFESGPISLKSGIDSS
jgi:hypothetical protein